MSVFVAICAGLGVLIIAYFVLCFILAMLSDGEAFLGGCIIIGLIGLAYFVGTAVLA